MRLKRNTRLLTSCLRAVAILMLVPTLCKAGGFALYEYSARGNAMGGATIALADDASAVAYNPAGITQLLGTNFMAGATAIAPVADVQTGSGAKTTTQANIYMPPHVYLTHQASDKAWIGMGVYTRFGVGTQYGVDWAGAYKIYRAELASYSFTPSLAVKLTDKLSVAFGPEIVYSSADLRKKLTGGTDVTMDVSGIGFGVQGGLHYLFNDQWSAGFTYHSSQQHTDRGKARYTNERGAPFRYYDDTLSIALTLPASYSLGVAYKPTKDLKVEADAIFTQWQDYKDMLYDFSSYPGTGTTGSQTVIKNWRNVWRFQLGAEYMVTPWLALRGGFVWDQDPIRRGYEDYMLPTNDRKIYSAGFGILDGKYTYDFAVSMVQNNDRSIDANGNIVGATQITNSRAYTAGFSLGYKF